MGEDTTAPRPLGGAGGQDNTPGQAPGNRTTPLPDRAAIRAALDVLFDPADVVELRVIATKPRKRISAGYFDGDHRDTLAGIAARENAEGAAAYVTLNPIDRQLLGRYNNRLARYVKATTTDRDVLHRRWLLVDLDPVRPAGVASTAEQLAEAEALALRCREELGAEGWPEPLFALSGNGFHLLYPLDLPNDDASCDLVKGALAGLAVRFDTETVKVDQCVFNAARITKLYGSVATKGDHTPSTPWRLSRLIDTPRRDAVVTVGQLRALAPAKPAARVAAPSRAAGPFNLTAFLERLGISYEQDHHDGRERYKLEHCPFNPEHSKGEAAIFRFPDGTLGFKCMHDHCADRHWQDVRALVDGPRESRGGGWTASAEDFAPIDDADREAIAELAALSPLDYDRVREQEAEALGVRLGTLDRLVEAARPKREAEEATDAMEFAEVEPWPEPVAGAGLLDEITATVQRFVVCAAETARAAALWCVMTWLIDVVGVAPIAAITSPEKRCGKTVLLTLLSRLAYRPLAASNISPAALFRAVEAWTPTLLIDEADSFLKDNEDLRGVLNSGHTRSTAFVIRCDGEDFTPKRFTTWGAKALAAIGHLPDTIADRAVPLKMRRKLADENVDRLRYAEPELFDTLRAKLARWAEDHREAIRHARPELPEALHDRAQDNFEPLLAIADTAGGEWPELAREAALKLYGAEPATLSVGVELLRDIKAAFDGENHLATAVLIEHLTEDPELRWATFGRGGKPLTARQLAARLRPYGIASGTVRDGDKTAKGYKREQFAEVWKRYLPLLSPDPPVPNVTTSQRNKNNELRDFSSVTSPPLVTDRKEAKSLILKDCDVVTDRKGGVAEKKGIDMIGKPSEPAKNNGSAENDDFDPMDLVGGAPPAPAEPTTADLYRDLIGGDPPAPPEKPWRTTL